MDQAKSNHVCERRAANALAILESIEASVKRGHAADGLLAHLYKKKRHYGSKDRRFYSAIVFSWFRWQGALRKLVLEAKPQAVAIAYLLDGNKLVPELDFLGLPEKLKKEPLPETVDEKLELLRQTVPELSDCQETDLTPSWILDLFSEPDELSKEAFLKMSMDAMQVRPPTWLRLPEQMQTKQAHMLKKLLPDATLHPVLPRTVSTTVRFNLVELQKQIHRGIEIQDISSQCVGLLCDAQPGERWWDMCTGSGGKALHLASLMKKKGSITASDIRTSILKNLRTRVKRSGFTDIIQYLSIEDMPENIPPFDGILIDAPCSSLGTIGRNPDLRWRITAKEVIERSATQRQLLKKAVPHVKPGGKLIYAVCTMTNAETMMIVESFLDANKDYKPTPLIHPLTGKKSVGTCWIYPWQGPCNGMFVACFTRN